MNPTAIFSKTGKGVQEASGKTSNLSRADRAVLKEIDGKTALGAIAGRFEKIPADKFAALIQQFDKDGYIREVSSGVTAPQAPPKAAPPPASDGDDEMDFTQAIKLPPKAAPAAPAAPKPPTVDLAAASRADAERKAKEQQALDYKARAEAEAKGRAEGRGAYSMSGPKPAALFEGGRIQGEFKIEQGVLGSFDLTRALQTGGAQSSGRTIFSELTGQAVYDKGTIKITNASITAGAMNAGASLDIDANGGLSGRVVADVKTPTQTLRATLNLSGKIQDPVIRK